MANNESLADGLNSLRKFRPLPEEIQKMAETETACQYCGISYLLLTKYEQMETHVKQMESEMSILKVRQYTNEHSSECVCLK